MPRKPAKNSRKAPIIALIMGFLWAFTAYIAIYSSQKALVYRAQYAACHEYLMNKTRVADAKQVDEYITARALGLYKQGASKCVSH